MGKALEQQQQKAKQKSAQTGKFKPRPVPRNANCDEPSVYLLPKVYNALQVGFMQCRET